MGAGLRPRGTGTVAHTLRGRRPLRATGGRVRVREPHLPAQQHELLVSGRHGSTIYWHHRYLPSSHY